MILFLDTVSPLPEFSLIEDNKIIYSNKILSNNDEKMSDLLIPTYIKLEKKFRLSNKIDLLLVNTGPGSYTALRVGISFFAGLGLSQSIDLIGLPCIDLFKFNIPSEELVNTGIFISSSNNQNFIYFYDLKENKFKIKKIEKDLMLNKQDIDLSRLNKIYTNEDINQNNVRLFPNIEIKTLSFSKLVNTNIFKIKNLLKNEIIEPIYCSNNKILN